MSDDASDRSAEQQSDLSCLSLADLDLQQDCFTVINNSPHDRGLEGCSVHSVAGGQVFTFPYQTLLPGGGGRITVWSGSKNKGKAKGGKQGGSRSNIFWTSRYIWNNHGDTAVLRGPDGEEELDRITSEVVFEQQAQQPLEQGEDGENDDDRGEAPESSVDSFLFLADLDLLQERVTICNGGADAVREQRGTSSMPFFLLIQHARPCNCDTLDTCSGKCSDLHCAGVYCRWPWKAGRCVAHREGSILTSSALAMY